MLFKIGKDFNEIGSKLHCPKCGNGSWIPSHFSWSKTVCLDCGKTIKKENWITDASLSKKEILMLCESIPLKIRELKKGIVYAQNTMDYDQNKIDEEVQIIEERIENYVKLNEKLLKIHNDEEEN